MGEPGKDGAASGWGESFKEKVMPKIAIYTSAVIFAVVSLFHWVRLALGTEVFIGGTEISLSVSLVAGIVSAGLAVWMIFASRTI